MVTKAKTRKRKLMKKKRNGGNNITLKNPHNTNTCSPFSASNKVMEHSCFSRNSLVKMKGYFNKNEKKQKKIESDDPKVIWKKLYDFITKNTDCSKESCWMDELVDNKLDREKLKLFFVPLQPKHWKKNKNAWLSNFDILNVLKQYEMTMSNFKFIGPAPIDFDPKKNGGCVDKDVCSFHLFKNKSKTKYGFVFNLDTHDKDGSHWVALYADLTDKFIYYFDSNGEKIPSQIYALVERMLKQAEEKGISLEFYQNIHTEHQNTNTECGMYVLYFIITMLSGKNEKGESLSKNQLIEYFHGKLDGRIKDSVVEGLRDDYFRIPKKPKKPKKPFTTI